MILQFDFTVKTKQRTQKSLKQRQYYITVEALTVMHWHLLPNYFLKTGLWKHV